MTATPTFLYGTAWKEEQTAPLTRAAIQAGFRGIDTANQRKHYFEQAVGDALQETYEAGKLARKDFFLQTKFTFVDGQDHRLPYDADADYKTQVQQSFASSLEHLRTDYIDSYILHGPSVGRGLSAADHEVWAEMELLYREKKVRMIGVSNVSIEQLRLLVQSAKVMPFMAQIRCFAANRWDKQLREFCKEHKIVYQGFSLLTANSRGLSDPRVAALAQKYQKTIPQIIFRFAQQVGMLPITGTTNAARMKEDLNINDFNLSEAEVNLIENIEQ